MAYMSQEYKKELAPRIKAVLKKYGLKGTISVRNHSGIAVKIQSGKVDFRNDLNTQDEYTERRFTGEFGVQVSPYSIDRNWGGESRNCLNELVEAMRGPHYFNDSDIQTDYFNRSHYVYITLGGNKGVYQVII